MTKYPIGIDDFSRIRKESYLYIDKTEFIYNFTTVGLGYFFSRPRRFGKSLLVSTLEALFQGKRDLFSGLWIDSSDYNWEEYPVIRLDLSKTISSTPQELLHSIQELIIENGEKYGIKNIKRSHPANTLSALVLELAKKNKVVILIDEYDKPLVHHINNPKLAEKNREALNEFYTYIKALGEHLRHVFVTGVSKFTKVSLFSGLNNLKDISLYDSYAALPGLTEKELVDNLSDEIDSAANVRKENREEVITKMRSWYNGYRFSSSQSEPTVYNPLSVISFLETAKIDNYWFSTATPTFAIELMKKQGESIPSFEEGIITGKEIELSHKAENIDLPTLLFQTGYLTIDQYDENSQTYLLKFPNEEVKRSFLQNLLQEYVTVSPSTTHTILNKLNKSLQIQDLQAFFDLFNQLFASIPHQIHQPQEGYYHSLIYLVLKTLGFQTEAEITTSSGRIDMVTKTKENIFLFEFKINQTAEKALKQILEKEYDKKYQLEPKTLILIGASFNTKTRSLDDWCSLQKK